MTDITIEDFCVGNLQETPLALFIHLISTLVAAKCALGSNTEYPDDYGKQIQNGNEFDFIIIGAGSGGSVVANKLTENKDWKVLVLEAGGLPSDTSDIPLLYYNVHGTSNDWQYKTQVSNNSCLGFKNKQCNIPKGKAIGGSSVLNDMIYFKGFKQDYDEWSEVGNSGWSWNDVQDYFTKIEHIQAPGDLNTHMGVQGLLPLMKTSNSDPIKQSLTEAYHELGIPYYDEQNPKKSVGSVDTPLCIQNGMRANIAKTILGTIKERPNLYVSQHSLVEKILIDPKTIQAAGVKVKIGDKTLYLKASKEVILAAGAINTPQLLILSGIGPTDHLKELNIPLIKNLPVGETLQDHLFFTGIGVKLDLNAILPIDPIDTLYEYFKHRTGLLSTTGISNYLSFISTQNDSDVPNVCYHHMLFPVSDEIIFPALTKAFSISDSVVQEIKKSSKYDPLILIIPGILNPKSRGKVRLRSDNINDMPLIFPEYMTDIREHDLQILLDAIRFVDKLLKTGALKKYAPELIRLPIPDCEKYEFQSDEYWICALRHLGTTFGHLTSTCPMGPTDDGKSVVDSQLKVHGINSLRIVDASIMPFIVSGGTQAPTMMIGYKAGVMITQDWYVKRDEL